MNLLPVPTKPVSKSAVPRFSWPAPVAPPRPHASGGSSTRPHRKLSRSGASFLGSPGGPHFLSGDKRVHPDEDHAAGFGFNLSERDRNFARLEPRAHWRFAGGRVLPRPYIAASFSMA